MCARRFPISWLTTTPPRPAASVMRWASTCPLKATMRILRSRFATAPRRTFRRPSSGTAMISSRVSTMRSKVAAAVSYYGVGIEGVLDEAKLLTAPLQLHIAADDALCPPSAQATIHRALEDIPGVILDTHTGVGHAFARRGGAP